MIVSWVVRPKQIARKMGGHLLALLVWDFFVVIAEKVMHWRWISWPDVPLALYGAAIGLLLSFRNASTYNRWWEARTLWGAIVNKSRTLARQVLNTISAGDGASASERAEVAAVQRRLVIYQVAYAHALRQQLRDLDPLTEIARLIPEEVPELTGQKNVPLAIQRKMGELLTVAERRGWLDKWEW